MKVSTQSISSKEYLASLLLWNKAETRVSAKDGERRIEFTSHPSWLNPAFPKIKYSLGFKRERGGVELIYVTPYVGLYPAVFTGFVRKPNEPPKLREVKQNWDGDTWSETQATARFKLTSEGFNGAEVIAKLVLSSKRDFLLEDANGKMEVAPIGKSKKLAFLVDFLSAVGLMEREFPFEHNPLPTWHREGRKLARPLNLLFEKGYVTKILPLDEFSEEPEENDDSLLDEDFSDEAPWQDEEEKDDDSDELEGFDN